MKYRVIRDFEHYYYHTLEPNITHKIRKTAKAKASNSMKTDRICFSQFGTCLILLIFIIILKTPICAVIPFLSSIYSVLMIFMVILTTTSFTIYTLYNLVSGTTLTGTQRTTFKEISTDSSSPLLLFLPKFDLKLNEEKNITIEEFNKIALFPDAKSYKIYASLKEQNYYNKITSFDIIFSHTIIDNASTLHVTDYRGIVIKVELTTCFDFIFIKDFKNKFQNNKNQNFINPNSQIYKDKNLKFYSQELDFYTDNLDKAKDFMQSELFKKLNNLKPLNKGGFISYAVNQNKLYIFIYTDFNRHTHFKKYGNNVCKLINFKDKSIFNTITKIDVCNRSECKMACKNVYLQLCEIKEIIKNLDLKKNRYR